MNTAIRWFWYASPQTFYPLAGRLARWCGAGAVEMASSGLGGQGQLLLLAAMLIVAAAFAPWAVAGALRISSE